MKGYYPPVGGVEIPEMMIKIHVFLNAYAVDSYTAEMVFFRGAEKAL